MPQASHQLCSRGAPLVGSENNLGSGHQVPRSAASVGASFPNPQHAHARAWWSTGTASFARLGGVPQFCWSPRMPKGRITQQRNGRVGIASLEPSSV